MDASQLIFLFFLIFIGMFASEYPQSVYSETTLSTCMNFSKNVALHKGEAFYFMPDDLIYEYDITAQEITWYKNNFKFEISSDEKERIHQSSGAILFLNLLTEDSARYIARHTSLSGECTTFYLGIDVFDTSYNSNLLYVAITSSADTAKVPCPDPVRKTCTIFKGKITWYKDSRHHQGTITDYSELLVEKATKDDEGMYTCICTWMYNHAMYNSSGSRILKVDELSSSHGAEILSPASEEQIAVKGLEIKLNCSVFCGINVEKFCLAHWYVNGVPFKQKDGYKHSYQTINEKPSKRTISTAVLTIEKVSANDFQDTFECFSERSTPLISRTLTLKEKESITPLVITSVCVLLSFVLAAVLIKCFAVDLALFFRPYIRPKHHNKDTRLYDAYVVYQMQKMDKDTEETLCQFVTQILPSVLEEKCGYRLFIYGRDDIPGEDHVELVEDSIKQSKRLIVILTPGSQSRSEISDHPPASPQNSVIGGFEWQVGLHHALVQREISVIMIQLGDTGPQGYKHLPAGLQHLILKSAPLKWPEGSRGAAAWNSRFWKRVRYLMPATPARKCLTQQSAIV